MASLSHETPSTLDERPSTFWRPVVTDVAASLAITVMWLTVLFDALFGPNIVTSDAAGTNTSSVPSGVIVALFAFLGSWVVARYAFRRDSRR